MKRDPEADEAAAACGHRPAGLWQVVEIEAVLGEPLVDALLVAGRQHDQVALKLRVHRPASKDFADFDLPQESDALGPEKGIG